MLARPVEICNKFGFSGIDFSSVGMNTL